MDCYHRFHYKGLFQLVNSGSSATTKLLISISSIAMDQNSFCMLFGTLAKVFLTKFTYLYLLLFLWWCRSDTDILNMLPIHVFSDNRSDYRCNTRNEKPNSGSIKLYEVIQFLHTLECHWESYCSTTVIIIAKHSNQLVCQQQKGRK